MKVKDAVAEGAAKVKVVLKSVEMCEEDGSAEQTTWAALAFNFSDNGRKRYDMGCYHCSCCGVAVSSVLIPAASPRDPQR